VSFSESSFANQFAHTSFQFAHTPFRGISVGDIKVLKHCPNITWFGGYGTGITGEFLGKFFLGKFFREPVRSNSVPRNFFR